MQGLFGFAADRDAVFRAHHDVGRDGFQPGADERLLDVLETVRRAQHRAAAAVGDDVVGAGIECDLEHLVFAAGFVRVEHELTKALELERDRTRSAKVAAMKVLVEIVLTPVTYAVVGFLKRREGVDIYDEHTHFTPFSLRDEGEQRAVR